MNLAVIGHTGVVGNAVFRAMQEKYKVVGVSVENMEDYNKIGESDVVFLCVPTPMKADGSVNLEYIHQAMQSIRDNLRNGIIVVKSTVLPGTNAQLSMDYPNYKFVSSPEFLTAAKANYDFKHQARIVIGSESKEVAQVIEFIYRNTVSCSVYLHVSPIEAELIKYFSNAFLAMKVIYANEGKRLADQVGADWGRISAGIGTDPRIGRSHLFVDGIGGYDGMCFPKDVSGIATYARSVGITLSLIEQTNQVNHQIRPELYKYE